MKKMTDREAIAETLEHIMKVRDLLGGFAADLLERGMLHDKSKMEHPELDGFKEFTPKLRSLTYGSPEYNETLKEMEPFLRHHYENNSHHPEFYKDGIKGMDLLDLVEMFFDWQAAVTRSPNGDIRKSIEVMQKRFGFSDDLKSIFLNTVVSGEKKKKTS